MSKSKGVGIAMWFLDPAWGPSLKVLIFYARGIFDFGKGLQWMHGLSPCTNPSLGCPPKLLLKLDDFSISFGDFSIFLWKFFVPQTKMELFRLTVGIFILWKFDDNKNKARMAIAMPMFCTPTVTKMFSLYYVGPLPLRFFHKYLTCHTLWISRSSSSCTSIKWRKRESKAADYGRQGLKKHCLFPLNVIISKSMQSKIPKKFHIFPY
jgi:hypothetical protein